MRSFVVAAAAAALVGQLAGTAPAGAVTGGLNRSFGAAGYVATRLGAQTSPGVSMDHTVVQSDGKLVTGGSVDGHPAAARFNADGSPDTAFGSGGVARLSSVSNFTGVSVALGAGSRILVLGATGVGTTAVVSFTAGGAVDPSFGSGGVATISNFAGRRLAVQPDGRIAIAGSRGLAAALTRLMPTGGTDVSFGSAGVVTDTAAADFEALTLDGTKIVAGGTKGGSASQVQGVLARFTSTGAMDGAFAGGNLTFAAQPSFVADVAVGSGEYAVAIGGDRQTYVAGVDSGGGTLWRGDVPIDGPVGIAVDGSGRIVMVGDDNRSSLNGRTEAVVGRLSSRGIFDGSFGCNGLSYFNWGNDFSTATGAVVLADSSVVVTGSTAGFEGDQKELVIAKLLAADPATDGYRMMNMSGDTEAFGAAAPCRTGSTIPFVEPPVDMAGLPGGQGDWMVASDGGVFAFGRAWFYGSMGGKPLNDRIVGIAAAPDGQGYWLAAADGGVFAFGSAKFYGSMGGKPLNNQIFGIAAAPDGRGYWLVGGDGGVFAFGSAKFYGSMGGRTINSGVTNIAAAPDGQGYWLIASDGGVFAFGSATFHGSMGGRLLQAPIVDLAVAGDGEGYWLLGLDGGIFAFGSAPYEGSMGSRPERGGWVALSEV